MKSKMDNKKPTMLLQNTVGHDGALAVTASIRKGQAFKSPLQPNKRTGTVEGIVSPRSVNGGAPCERLHGIASLPTAKRKLDVGCNRDWPIRTSNLPRSIVMAGSIGDGFGSEFIGLAFRTTGTCKGHKLPLSGGKESYVYRSGFSPSLYGI